MRGLAALCYVAAFICVAFGMMVVALPLLLVGMALEKRG